VAGRDRIARLRRELNLRCKQKRKFKATTNSNHDLPVADNLLNQTFEPTRPNEAWVTDITYVHTGEGWLYVAGVKDVFTCELVGYAMGERMTQGLTAQALWRAVRNKRPQQGLIHHSDRGSRYCAHDYRKLVKQFGMQAVRAGCCLDGRLNGATQGNAGAQGGFDQRRTHDCTCRSSDPCWSATSARRPRRM
jgi:transposase InsO family protein